VTTHILHRAEALTVAEGEDSEIEIAFRSRDDLAQIERIGVRKEDVSILIEALATVRDGRSKRVTIREDERAA